MEITPQVLREFFTREMGEEPAWLSNEWVGCALKRLGFTDIRETRRKGERTLLIPRSCIEILKKTTGQP